MSPYSLLITSCDRDDLLKRTVESYLKVADAKPREIIIVDNGPKRPEPAFLHRFKHLGVKWICEGVNRGQIYSCDRLWQECKYDWAMWAEEDWNFSCGDFVVRSFEILEKYPEILTVTLRGDWNHPLINDARFPGIKIAQPNWKDVWGGFTFNPGLRRKSDWLKIGSYGKHCGYGTHGLSTEIPLSKLYGDMGHVLAAIPDRISHIGGGRSRSVNPLGLVTPPKVLIAVLASHALEYGAWESEDSPAYSQKKAWQGRPYGTDIHISGPNARVPAVRETWAKDFSSHKNATVKFFYGDGPKEMLDDEVLLKGVPDDYAHLPQKTIAICGYAKEHGFDYVLKCDDDSYLWADRLMLEVQSVGDFAGHINGGTCSGGCGYWLSKRAFEEVVRNPIESHWAEDVTVGMIMKAAGIPPQELPMHQPGGTAHWFMNGGFDASKLHNRLACIHAVQPEMMRKIYEHETSHGLSANG